MNCPACGGPLQPDPGSDSLVCEYCKNVVLPQKNDDGVAILGEAKDEPCPVCAIPLMQGSLERVEIRYCTKCRGMLAPMGTFPELIDALRERYPGKVDVVPANPEELKRKLTCPRCHQPMVVDFYPAATSVVIGSCERDAVNWVDHGKMARIVDGARELRENDERMLESKLERDFRF
jgi:Zn-finger nucleic acid-binding protein